ncbi:uncharacterized protein LOC123225668 [Mangifera indica]|uniref:uncharacterized protein LOC123225668 n=1 Tax=Mangifera indica TaxID=29780 RepID=UPI001CFC4355|nr:uncharacterized protein LOC123225668 [Mangifera indica]
MAKDAVLCLCCYLFKPNVGDKGGGDDFVSLGHSSKSRTEYRTCLNDTIECAHFLLRQGLTFCGYDESDNSNNQGNFLKLLPFCGHDEFDNSNNQGNFLKLLQFLVDPNEYVYDVVFENALDNLKLTSPMIQNDIVSVTSNATLALLALAKSQDDVNGLFNIMAIIVNIVSASSKYCDILRDQQAYKVTETLSNGELSRGRDLNQETNLKRVNDMQLQELNNLFNEINMELLLCLACLCPNENFVAFDKQKLMHLAELYPEDFPDLELMALGSQLDLPVLV